MFCKHKAYKYEKAQISPQSKHVLSMIGSPEDNISNSVETSMALPLILKKQISKFISTKI